MVLSWSGSFDYIFNVTVNCYAVPKLIGIRLNAAAFTKGADGALKATMKWR